MPAAPNGKQTPEPWTNAGATALTTETESVGLGLSSEPLHSTFCCVITAEPPAEAAFFTVALTRRMKDAPCRRRQMDMWPVPGQAWQDKIIYASMDVISWCELQPRVSSAAATDAVTDATNVISIRDANKNNNLFVKKCHGSDPLQRYMGVLRY